MPWVDVDYARSVVKQMYPADTWRRRVRGMSDEQVLAIYYRHEEDRAKKRFSASIGSKRSIENHETPSTPFTSDEGEQLILAGIF